jgi:hypothetical protein
MKGVEKVSTDLNVEIIEIVEVIPGFGTIKIIENFNFTAQEYILEVPTFHQCTVYPID